MATPVKDMEAAFWTWLAGVVTLPADLKIKRSYLGEALSFAADNAAFQDPAQMPAMWLVPGDLQIEDVNQNGAMLRTVFAGGLAMAADQAAPVRDTFEALVWAIRRAILGRLPRDQVAGLDIYSLGKEKLVAHRASFAGAVLGYVWTFELMLGQDLVHFP